MTKGIGGNTGNSGGAKGIGGTVGRSNKGIGGETGNADYSTNNSNDNNSPDTCFVATAAFGTPWEPEIQILRDWRDTTLRSSSYGRAFIRTYYNKGPVVARFIKKYPIFKKPIRGFVRIFIKLIK